jgi:hypothetical protein
MVAWRRGTKAREEAVEARKPLQRHSQQHGTLLQHWSARRVLTLGQPRDEVVTEKHCVAKRGLLCIRTTCPISIRPSQTKSATTEGRMMSPR